jgi:hypothetical protein
MLVNITLALLILSFFHELQNSHVVNLRVHQY